MNRFKFLFARNKGLSTDQLIWKRTVISFAVFIGIGLGLFASWRWLQRQPTDTRNKAGILQPLRTVLDKNERLFDNLISNDHLTKEYAKSRAVTKARVNGNVGMSPGFDDSTWQMKVVKANGDTLRLTVDSLKKLPKTEVVFNFKCIEGWSQITWWGGVRFSDFIKAYHLEPEAAYSFVSLVTPDKAYYVGIDMRSALHPQTLLCYELNGHALPMNQGYPLRLIIPVKYGVKSIKRIGTLSFANERPPDYWAERGYDYFTGL